MIRRLLNFLYLLLALWLQNLDFAICLLSIICIASSFILLILDCLHPFQAYAVEISYCNSTK